MESGEVTQRKRRWNQGKEAIFEANNDERDKVKHFVQESRRRW